MWQWVQRAIVLFMLIYMSGVTGPSKLPEGGVDPVAGKISIILQLIIIPPFMLLLLVNRRKVYLGLRAAFYPMLVSVMLVLSTSWSLEPRFTLRRSLIFVFIALFGVYLGSCFSLREQIELYGKIVMVTIVSCFLIAILLPDYGISSDVHAGEWKGVFQHKNILGRQMAFCFALLLGGKPFRSMYVRWGTIAATMLLLLLSRSGTGLLGVLSILAAYFLIKIIRIQNRKTLPLWLALVPLSMVGMMVAFTFRDSVFALIGKDSTLTGRTRIWEAARHGIALHPWLGYGYSTYWRQSIIGRMLPPGLVATHAHDGYYDILLDIGYIGMLFFLLTLFSYLYRTLKKLLDQRVPVSNFTVFAFLFIVMFLSLNLTESNLLREHTFLWLPLISIYTGLGMQEMYDRRAATAAARADANLLREEELVLQTV